MDPSSIFRPCLISWSDYSKTLAFDTLSSLVAICNSKDPTPLPQRSGIYQVLCGDCASFYTEQIGRSLEDRLAEYSSTSINGVNKSAFAKHIRDSGHDVTRAKTTLRHLTRKGRVMNELEEIEVFIHDSDPLLLNGAKFILVDCLITHLFASTISPALDFDALPSHSFLCLDAFRNLSR